MYGAVAARVTAVVAGWWRMTAVCARSGLGAGARVRLQIRASLTAAVSLEPAARRARTTAAAPVAAMMTGSR
jgi:hypothetical protein